MPHLTRLTDYPIIFGLISFLLLWLAAWVGVTLLRRNHEMDAGVREDFGVVLAATLTLLGLILGFSFSMAVTRYDQRKNLEEEEANAIGTQYLRAGLLPAADAAKMRALLKDYLDLRIQFYTARDVELYREINARTAKMQTELWNAVQAPALAQPSPITALAAAGMNDVLNSQGYTQAAWWNRIPRTAWVLMFAIAIVSNLLVGYGARSAKLGRKLLPVLPLVAALTFMLIADIDSPRGGLIRVSPQNLHSLEDSLRTP
jgi:hypothetical protein